MRLAIGVVAVLAGGSLAQTIETPAEVVIRGIGVIDVDRGRVVPAQDLVVRGTRIERITAAGGPLPPGKTTIDGRGKFAMPGLIEVPVRLAAFSPATLQRLLAVGITAVFDVGTDPARLARWRQDLNQGRLYAPRLAEGCGTASTVGVADPSRTSPDAPDAIHDELIRLVSSTGRTTAQALRAVTLDRARSLCLDRLGRLGAGYPADLVVLAANPLDDIRHTRAIDAVVFRGEVLTQAHVNQLRRGALPVPTPPR